MGCALVVNLFQTTHGKRERCILFFGEVCEGDVGSQSVVQGEFLELGSSLTNVPQGRTGAGGGSKH